MCWGVPAKIIKLGGNFATADISGVRRQVVLDLVSNIAIGDYVLVHAGYAIQKVDAEKAQFTMDFFNGVIK